MVATNNVISSLPQQHGERAGPLTLDILGSQRPEVGPLCQDGVTEGKERGREEEREREVGTER